MCGAVRVTNSPAMPCSAASRAGAGQLLTAAPHPAVELEFADAAVRERELLAQRGDLFALALVLVQRGPQPGTQRGVARALADGQPRRRGAWDGSQRLDLGAQLGVLRRGTRG